MSHAGPHVGICLKMVKRTVLLGSGNLALNIAAEISVRPRCNYALLGVIGETADVDLSGFACQRLGSMENIQFILSQTRPENIIVAPHENHSYLSLDRVTEYESRGNVAVESGFDAYEKLTGKLAIESLTPDLTLYAGCFHPSRTSRLVSRILSLLLAGVGLLLSFPAMAIIAVAIKLDSSGPVLFTQERIGAAGQRFMLFKFRSMHVTDAVHTEWEKDNLKRITRVGRVLRKYRLDELPQFMNVLFGHMNMVGPRPHPSTNEHLFMLVSRNTPQRGNEIPYYMLRCVVKPGITGWAQVHYKYANGLDEEMEKLRYDLYYIKHYSPLLDIRILLETVAVVLFGNKAGQRRIDQLQTIRTAGNSTDTFSRDDGPRRRLPPGSGVPAAVETMGSSVIRVSKRGTPLRSDRPGSTAP
jgi:lipopolysaccharide/colanic/teichoic acid biosynthesis glycosyltransferase